MTDRVIKPVIAVTVGDPAGVGPEIVVKAVASDRVRAACRPVIFADLPVLERAMQATGVWLPLRETAEPLGPEPEDAISVANPHSSGDRAPVGVISREGGAAAFAAIQMATEFCLHGEGTALATAPINKESFKAAGVPYLDHTATLQGLTGAPSVLTLFVTGELRVFFATRHLAFRDIARHVTKANLTTFTQDAWQQMQRLGFAAPRLVMAALNPHGGEHGLFGDEEMLEIGPAVAELNQQGIDIRGPIPADSVFNLALEGHYDAVISLYHDQGHIATKTLDFYRTVSLTLGLPFLRTSVDHGTAFDLAGTGAANEISMIEAILAAAKYGPAWRHPQTSPEA